MDPDGPIELNKINYTKQVTGVKPKFTFLKEELNVTQTVLKIYYEKNLINPHDNKKFKGAQKS